MLEFILVGPLITLIGLGALQYGLLFFDKNQINHASFMAGRAGAMGSVSFFVCKALVDFSTAPLAAPYAGQERAARW